MDATHPERPLALIDRDHAARFESTRASSRKGIKYDSCRDGLYLKLMTALRDAGETGTATELDRFRGFRTGLRRIGAGTVR